ncbi:Protein of unknown function [Salinibacillus kushneri]|uniref:DUF3231 family protein n=2 Tax=Salinibacillus kushneri TaxID=237682 RepID=A0A1I0AQS7_9BACI|nr:Protein of unknown function [Salinibacillus kushneri]
MNDQAITCSLHYFLNTLKDEEIKPLVQHALELAEGNLHAITEIFNKDNYPIPYGFNLEEDVNVNAPELFSDSYILNYLHLSVQIALQNYSLSLSQSVRKDVYSYFNECITQLTELLRETKELLLSKGLYQRSPYLPIPEHNDFVKKQSFMTGYFGERRPLLGLEISNLYANFQRNALGVATMIGFSQVASRKDVRQFLIRGKDIAQKHCEIFGSILREDNLDVPSTWDTEVTDSTTYTYSDKLMMYYSTTLIALSVGYYGASMSMSPRRDIGIMYGRLSQEILKYAEDGANIMIKHGWMEEPPRALDRDELAKKNKD